MSHHREVRYQAAVIADDRLLLLQCRPHAGGEFWLLPGGGIEEGESEVECIAREVREEAGMDVTVGALLYDMPADPPDGTYMRWRTYRCTPGFWTPTLGTETWAQITAFRWLPLSRLDAWGASVCENAYLFPQLLRIRAIGLGVSAGAAAPSGANDGFQRRD